MNKKVFKLIGIVFTCMGFCLGILCLTLIFFVQRTPLMLIGVAPSLVFTIVGIVFLVVVKKSEEKEILLKQEGRMIWATVTDVEIDYTYRVNNRYVQYIWCEYEDGMGKVERYKSQGVHSPQVLAKYPVGCTIPVYVDRKDSSRYWVDVN